ncbi:hypothetical protein [Serratia phage vB_SspM_LC53]|nr:hypothetical protein [Serratia phage vB_SspM_LC53]
MVVQYHDIYPSRPGYSDDCDCTSCEKTRHFEEKYGFVGVRSATEAEIEAKLRRKQAEMELAEEHGFIYEENTMGYIVNGYQPRTEKPKENKIDRVVGFITLGMVFQANYWLYLASDKGNLFEVIFGGLLINFTCLIASIFTTRLDGCLWYAVKAPFVKHKEKKYQHQKSISDFIKGCRK